MARATVDCCHEDEELTGFATMIGDNLTWPDPPPRGTERIAADRRWAG